MSFIYQWFLPLWLLLRTQRRLGALGARLAGATRKRECSPIFRHGTVGTFDDLGPVKEHLNGLDGSGS